LKKVAKLDHFYLKKHALAFVPGKYFHLCLLFEIMAGTSSSKAPFWLLALPTDIKVPLKNLAKEEHCQFFVIDR